MLLYNYLVVAKSRDLTFLYLVPGWAILPFKMFTVREFALLKISFYFSTSAAIHNLNLNLIPLNINHVQTNPPITKFGFRVQDKNHRNPNSVALLKCTFFILLPIIGHREQNETKIKVFCGNFFRYHNKNAKAYLSYSIRKCNECVLS